MSKTNDDEVYNNGKFRLALEYASVLHAKQIRKGAGDKGIPYLTHLLSVAALVGEQGGGTEEVVAGLLHDALEDHSRGGRTAQEILAMFGPQVLSFVEGCTNHFDDRAMPMHITKPLYLQHLKAQPTEVHRIALADKLHNARTTVLNLRSEGGEVVWKRFRGGKDDTLSYYRMLGELFSEVIPGEFANEFTACVYIMHAIG